MKSVDIVFPVYYGNIDAIEGSFNQVYFFCKQNLKNYDWQITFAINGPFPEKIIALVKRITKTHQNVNYTYTPAQGKGFGIKQAWMNSSSDFLAYMDIDLSTDISILPSALGELANYDAVMGSRYNKNSDVKRNLKRKIISKVYHTLFQNIFLGVRCKDAHCGFKIVRADSVKKILPHIQDGGWYFDSELIYLLSKLKYSIKYIPVKWRESKYESGVNLRRVIPGFVIKSLEMKLRPLPKYVMKGSV